MTVLQTRRLVLRPATPDDLEPLHAILSDADAMAFWSTEPHSRLDQTRRWLDAMIAIPPGEGEDFVVVHDDQVIGKAGLYRFPEIGFIFHPRCWGQGFAREALEAVIVRAFAVHALPFVHADVDPRNSASLGLLDKLGFRETGRAANTYRVGGRWCDSIYLRLDRPEPC